MIIRIILLISAVISTLLYSCKKQYNTAYIDPELKKHFNFKAGTYWIYRDSLTGSMDTFTVYGNTTTITESNPGYSLDHIERQEMEIRCSDSSNVYKCSYTLSNSSILVLFYHLQLGLGTSYNNFRDHNALKSYTFNSIVFDSVSEARNGLGTLFGKKDIGFVKITLMKDSIKKVWELQQWKIVQ